MIGNSILNSPNNKPLNSIFINLPSVPLVVDYSRTNIVGRYLILTEESTPLLRRVPPAAVYTRP
jgi:hypothetical protein